MAGYSSGILKNLYDLSPRLCQEAAVSLYGFDLERRAHGAHYRSHLRSLVESQWWNGSQLELRQRELLHGFIRFAFRHSSYWRDRMTELGTGPDDIRRPGDLTPLAVMDKSILRDHMGEITADVLVERRYARQSVSMHTSGTTGTALSFPMTRSCWEREYALKDLQRSWAGIQRGSRVATFAGHPVVPVDANRPPFWRHNWAANQLFFSSQHIATSNLPHYVAELEQFDPQVVHGYPTPIYLVALYCLDRGVDSIRPKAVFAHSETLLEEHRVAIERAFSCKVFNWYGNAETAGSVIECEEGGLHIQPLHSLVEVVRTDGAPAQEGEAGELVGTAFGNPATPLIRYRTGDAVVMGGSTCRCGRSGPLLREITGRVNDYIVTPDGRFVAYFASIFSEVPDIAEAQLYQESASSLTVRVVRRPGYGSDDETFVERGLHARLGESIQIRFEYLDSIPRERNGKFRFVVSQVPVSIGGSTVLNQGEDSASATQFVRSTPMTHGGGAPESIQSRVIPTRGGQS